MGKADTAVANEAAQQPATEPLAAKVDRIVDAWYSESVANSPVSRETGAWNHMQEVKARLKEALITGL